MEPVRRIGSAGLGRSRGYGVNVVIENLSHVRCQNGAGRALRAVASIALAAASLVAPAAAYGAVSEQAEQNITFSIPTSLRCAVRADGTVIAPSGWSMSNSGSGKVEITGVSVSNAIGKLRLSGKSDSVGYAVGEGSGSYTVSYDAADGCKFSSTPNRPLGIESGKSLSWNWNIGKLNASDHRAALDSAASGRARLCDMSFSYAPVGNSLSSEGTTGLMSGTVDSQSSSIVPVGGTATANVGNAPSNATLSYQWYTVDSNDSYSAIANANGKTLKVLAAYRGKDIVCRVSDSSGHYSGYVETARKPVRNLVPKVGISGSAVYGSKLAAAASGLPSGATYTYKYKWQRLSGSSWIDIANATAAEYTLGGEDVGKQVRVIVSTASNIYTVDDVTAASATVAKAKASIGVSISGTKNNSSRLTASVSGLPAAGTNTVSYRWQRSSDGKSNWVDSTAGDAKSNSIQMQPNDVSWHYRCIVSASNPYYDIASSTSAAYGPIAKSTVSAAKATVSGNAVYGGTIKANVANVPAVGTNSISYQWQYSDDGKTWNDTRLDGGKNQSLVLSAVSCVGKYYHCVISVDNSYYIVPNCTTDGVKVGKRTVDASVSVSGTKSVSSKLTANVSGLPGTGTNTVAYKWQRSRDGSTGWTDSGYADAKASSITMHAEDVGHYYRCIITVSGNAYYNINGATSAAYGPIGKGSHASPTVSVSGTKAYGYMLTANVSGQPNGTTRTTYQWQRNSGSNGAWVNISNATGKTYVLTGNDINHSLRVLVNTSNTYYNVSQGVSAAYGTINKASKTISASVSGTKNNTSKLTVSVSGLPTVGTNTVSYQWQRSKDGSTGWTNSSYSDGKSNTIQMRETDVGYYYRCVVSVSGNAYYNVTGATTSAYGPMAKSSHAAPTVSVSGSKTYGSTLTAVVSGQPNGTTATSYQWQRASNSTGTWSDISNATGKTYKLGTGDMSQYFRVLVGTTSTYYTVSQGVSPAYGAIGKATTTITATVSGTKTIGSKLTVSVGGLPSVGTNTIAYRWQYSSDNKTWTDSNSTGAKSNVITTDTTWINKYARCIVTVSGNAYYNVNCATSAAYGPIGKTNHFAPTVSVSGDKIVGATLTASVSGQPSGTTSTTYQWQRADAVNGTYVNISGATSKTYKTANADANKYVRVLVNTANTYYTVSQGVSAGYGAITLEAFAVYSADDNSLDFYKRGIPTIGETFNGKTATAVYTGIEKDTYKYYYTVPWHEYQSNITTSTIVDNGIAPISTAYWFYHCMSLTSVNLSKFDTSNVANMRNMFEYCSALISLDLSGWNTSNVTSMMNMFDGCSALTSVGDLSGWDTSNVRSMGGMFNACLALTSIGDLSGWNTSNVVNMGRMFLNCSALDSVGNLSGWNTSNVRSMEGMFASCSALTFVGDLSGWNSSNVTKMEGMFSDCSSIVSVGDFSGWDTSNVTRIGSMFANCHALTFVGDLSGWNTSKVTDMSDMFVGCSSLASVGNLSEWNTSNVTNMVYMFADCHALTSVGDLSRWDTSKVTDMASMFADCSTLTSLNFSGWDTSKVTNMNNMFLNCSKLQEITLGNNWKWIRTNSYGYLPAPNSQYIPGADGKWYAKSDGAAYAPADIPSNKADTYSATTPKEAFAVYSADDNSLDFYKRSTIPEVGKTFNGKTATAVYTGIEKDSYDAATIPWKQYQSNIATSTVVDDIAPTSTKCWFIGCGKITSINLNKLNTSRITTMANMFDRCYSLTSLNLSSLNTSNVISTSWMFNGCSALTSVGDLSGWNTSNLTNISYMFNGCSALTSIGDISGWNTSKVTSMEWMFNNCFKLTSVGTLSKWNTSKVASIDGIFYHCHALTSLNLSKWDLSNVTNMNGMFYNCYSLTSVGDLSGWNTSKVTNMSEMFDGCKSLTSVGNLSRWNTSKVTDMSAMFSFCDELISINLSGWDTFNVTNMRDMFKCCSSLTSIDGLSRLDVYKVTDMSDMFNYCSSLISLDLSGWKTSNVIYMEGMFYNCFKLASINGLSQWNTSNVMYMSSMFRECNKLVTDCSKWNVSKVKGHENFNYNAPEVIAPVWLYSDEITNEDFIAPLNRESKIENIGQEKSDNDKNLIDKENNAEEFQGTNNALTEQNNQNDDVDN